MSAGRRPLVAGNWKMHKTAGEAREFCTALAALVGPDPAVDVAVCPPFTALEASVDALAESSIAVYAQNVHEAASGAHQIQNRIAHRVEHPSNDAVPARVQRHLDQASVVQSLNHARAVAHDGAIIKVDPRAERAHRLFTDGTVNPGPVGLRHLVARMHQSVGQLTIVGQQQ